MAIKFGYVFKQVSFLISCVTINIGIDEDILWKNIGNKFKKSVDDMYIKLKNNQNHSGIIDVSESIWSPLYKRWYKIRFYANYKEEYIWSSIQAYR